MEEFTTCLALTGLATPLMCTPNRLDYTLASSSHRSPLLLLSAPFLLLLLRDVLSLLSRTGLIGVTRDKCQSDLNCRGSFGTARSRGGGARMCVIQLCARVSTIVRVVSMTSSIIIAGPDLVSIDFFSQCSQIFPHSSCHFSPVKPTPLQLLSGSSEHFVWR